MEQRKPIVHQLKYQKKLAVTPTYYPKPKTTIINI